MVKVAESWVVDVVGVSRDNVASFLVRIWPHWDAMVWVVVHHSRCTWLVRFVVTVCVFLETEVVESKLFCVGLLLLRLVGLVCFPNASLGCKWIGESLRGLVLG